MRIDTKLPNKQELMLKRRTSASTLKIARPEIVKAGVFSAAVQQKNPVLLSIQRELKVLKREGKISLAYLFGSYSEGTQNVRSDIDLGVYFTSEGVEALLESKNRILMATDKDLGLLRLEDEDEAPEIVLEALNGLPLIDEDDTNIDVYSRLFLRALKEVENLKSMEKFWGVGR